MILVSALTVIVQVGAVPLHPPPCQPVSTMEGSGVAASLTLVPDANDAEQPLLLLPDRQEIPDGVLTTAPVPPPAKAIVSSKFVVGGGGGGGAGA